MSVDSNVPLGQTISENSGGLITDEQVWMPTTPDAGIDGDKMKFRADIGFPWISLATSLRGEYTSGRLGIPSNATSPVTDKIQEVIDWIQTIGGGTLHMLDGVYPLDASKITDKFSNFGAEVPANTGCLILRPNVSLVGNGRARCGFVAVDPRLTLIYQIAPVNAEVSGMTLQGGWDPSNPNSGAGNGLFTLATAGGVSYATINCIWRDLAIGKVASYALALQNGYPIGCKIDDVIINTIGADGLDLKARDPNNPDDEPYGNSTNNILIVNHGGRVTGSCGIDTRGIWNHKSVHVMDFGGNPVFDYNGVRFRTKDTASAGYPGIANRSTLDGFVVRPRTGAAVKSVVGVISGSDDCHISKGTVVNPSTGVQFTGNSIGNATHNSVTQVSVVGATAYAFEVGVNCDNIELAVCSSRGSAVGFRNNGTHTGMLRCKSIGDATPLSTGGVALATQVIIGSTLGPDSNVTVTGSSGRVSISPVGDDANITTLIQGKGASPVWLNSPLKIASYVFASVPVAGAWRDCYICISDRSNRLAVSDGVNWRFMDGVIVT